LEFDQFATQIAHFNAGHQSPEETLERIESLLGKDAGLMAQMRLLVKRAVTEAGNTSTHTDGMIQDQSASVLVGDSSTNFDQ
jgi:hypothetical protein